MLEAIIERQKFPEPIFSCINSDKIRVFEDNGNIILSPFKNKPNVNELYGMLKDGKLSSDDFIKEKLIEKEMEK